MTRRAVCPRPRVLSASSFIRAIAPALIVCGFGVCAARASGPEPLEIDLTVEYATKLWDLARAVSSRLPAEVPALSTPEPWSQLADRLGMNPREAAEQVLGRRATILLRSVNDQWSWVVVGEMDQATELRLRRTFNAKPRKLDEQTRQFTVEDGRYWLLLGVPGERTLFALCPKESLNSARAALASAREQNAQARAQNTPSLEVNIRRGGRPAYTGRLRVSNVQADLARVSATFRLDAQEARDLSSLPGWNRDAGEPGVGDEASWFVGVFPSALIARLGASLWAQDGAVIAALFRDAPIAPLAVVEVEDEIGLPIAAACARPDALVGHEAQLDEAVAAWLDARGSERADDARLGGFLPGTVRTLDIEPTTDAERGGQCLAGPLSLEWGAVAPGAIGFVVSRPDRLDMTSEELARVLGRFGPLRHDGQRALSTGVVRRVWLARPDGDLPNHEPVARDLRWSVNCDADGTIEVSVECLLTAGAAE